MTDIVEYGSEKQLNDFFMNGKFKMDRQVAIGGDVYTVVDASTYSITETLLKNKNPMVVYTKEGSTNEYLVFCWEATSRNAIHPSGCATITLETGSLYKKIDETVINELAGSDKITLRPDQLVGDLVKVSFTGLNNPKELMGKIDTGATVSSLHSDNFKINGQQITFTCGPLSNNSITVPLKTQHAVKSPDGGTVYRPVVELDVKVNGKLIKGAMFNLNDRSHMDQPVLIGQNILQSGKFFVDPSRTESVEAPELDWEFLQETSVAIPMLYRDQNEEVLAEFYQQMLESDITFNDLVRHIRREVIKTFEDIE